MAGSGTTLVQAKLLGRHAIGFDVDPLACLISRVKCTEVDPEAVLKVGRRIVSDVHADLAHEYYEGGLPELPNAEYWFTPKVASQLAALSRQIQRARASGDVRSFLWVCFSSLILAKESVANARDIIHSRHHHRPLPSEPDVIERFGLRLRRMTMLMRDFREALADRSTKATVRRADARRLPLRPESVDLVFTSPPYATALDYQRSHFLAVAWMTQALGLSLGEYKKLKPAYIGTTAAASVTLQVPVDRGPGSLGRVATSLAEQCPAQARIIRQYFCDMHMALKEAARVLRTKRHAIIVVCPSHIRKVAVPTDIIFEEMAESVGLATLRKHERFIEGSKRVLPFQRASFPSRMYKEYVLVMQKMK